MVMVSWEFGGEEIVEAGTLQEALTELVRCSGSRLMHEFRRLPPAWDDSGRSYRVWVDLAYDWDEDFWDAEDADDIESDVVHAAIDILEEPHHADRLTELLSLQGTRLRCGKGRSLGKVWCTVRGTVSFEAIKARH